MSEQNERLELLGALLVKSVNHASKLPEPLRSLVSAASDEMTKEQYAAQYKLFDESDISGFTVGMYEDGGIGKALRALSRALDAEAKETDDADESADDK